MNLDERRKVCLLASIGTFLLVDAIKYDIFLQVQEANMTKKTTIGENKDFQIIRIESMAAICCGKVPYNSICIRKKGGFQQLNLDEEKFKSLQELLSREYTERPEQPFV